MSDLNPEAVHSFINPEPVHELNRIHCTRSSHLTCMCWQAMRSPLVASTEEKVCECRLRQDVHHGGPPGG